MFQENYLNKLKAIPEWLRQFGGLVIVTLIIILSFVATLLHLPIDEKPIRKEATI